MKDPKLAKEIAAIRTEMDLENKVYAESLSGMRKAAQLTQEVVAQKLGITQAGVSRLEYQADMYLSTFANYLEAVGSNPRIMITVAGQEIELDLKSFSRKS
jgi:DNA-binding transcriptional regulator YiaG